MEQIIPFSVCVNYHDYLDCALQRNRKLFKEYHIITTAEDLDTQKVCREHDVNIHLFQHLTVGRAKFNKSGMIHHLQTLLHAKHPDRWMLTLDADICLPDNFQALFEAQESVMKKHALYSLPRLDFHDYNHYKEGKNGVKYAGQDFMGFCQLYFDKTKYYDDFSHSCRACDAKFCNAFKEHFLLDDAVESHVHHLGQDTQNHFGRRTPRWQPVAM